MSLPDLQVLKESIPGKARRTIYTSWVVLVILQGAAAAAYAAIPATLPTALVVVAAVLLYLGIPIGTLAAVNVPTQLPPAGGSGTTVILTSDPEAIASVTPAKLGKTTPLVRRAYALVVGMLISLVLAIANFGRPTSRIATGRPIRA